MKKNISWNKKKIFIISLIILFIGFFLWLIIFKFTTPYKASLYFFQSYVAPNAVKDIEKKYTYKEYKSSSDFEFALQNNKAIGGVNTDYSIATLISNGYLAKISDNIEKVFNVKKSEYRLYYGDMVYDHLNWFNENYFKPLKIDNDKDGQIDDIFDYVIPYFINDRVFMYNISKVHVNQNQLDFGAIYPDFKKVLTTLNQNNFKNILWTKNEIENTVFGSLPNFSTKITNENYQNWLNNFANTILECTNEPIGSFNNIFEADSDAVLNNTINPDSKIQASVLYNGDALDAYYSSDNFTNVPDGSAIRIVRTNNNIKMVDGFVVSKYLNESEIDNLLINLKEPLFNGIYWTTDQLNQQIQKYLNQSPNNDRFSLPGMMNNTNYVNYTPASKAVYEYFDKYYFLDEVTNEVDKIAQSIFEIPINKPNVYNSLPIFPLNKQVQSNLEYLFKQKLISG